MNNKSIVLSTILAAALAAPIAQAATTDTYVVNGNEGQTGYVYTAGVGSAAATVSFDPATGTANLMAWSYSAAGYMYWRGNIPASSVTSNGMNSISVSVNTCEINNTAGCGQVDVTVTADVPANGWVDNGVSAYTGNGFIYRQVGSRSVRFASSTGSVNGVPVDNTRAFMIKATDVTVDVTVGE